MPDPQLIVDGDDSFVMGMDSYTSPGRLGQGEYVSSLNTINRGGVIQTRPGSVSLLDLPAGNLQGCTLFTPSSGVPCIVAAVNGLIHVSQYPFSSYSVLSGIQFSPYSKQIAWALTEKFTEYNSGTGIIEYLDTPVSILMIQDGSTRAAYYDGLNAAHLNPTKSYQEISPENLDETPIGLWMKWSGNRLWVSRGKQIFASDIGDPTKFTESQYLNEGRSFYLTGDCTGMAETPDKQGIICFTANTATLFMSSIQDRTKWLSTAGFQQELMPNIGCISARSIIQQYGLLWWFSSKGLVSQDSALQTRVTSRMDVRDTEMIQSKYGFSYDLSGVCGGSMENFLFHAVPFESQENTRIHVMDTAPFEGNANSWPSFWTGWRPVEFAVGTVRGKDRVFAASADQDGINRLWELFRSEKADNGIPITSYVATRQHFFGSRDYKKLLYMEVDLIGISGKTAVSLSVSGIRGSYQKIMSKDITATNGQVYAGSLYGTGANLVSGSRTQTRIVYSQQAPDSNECNSGCVESPILGLIDKGFSALITWSGIAGINAYRIFAQPEVTVREGICEVDEEGSKLINANGCSFLDDFGVSDGVEVFYSTVQYNETFPVSGDASKTCTRSSTINQADSRRKALAAAQWYVMKQGGSIP
jgi:hypothetical protein